MHSLNSRGIIPMVTFDTSSCVWSVDFERSRDKSSLSRRCFRCENRIRDKQRSFIGMPLIVSSLMHSDKLTLWRNFLDGTKILTYDHARCRIHWDTLTSFITTPACCTHAHFVIVSWSDVYQSFSFPPNIYCHVVVDASLGIWIIGALFHINSYVYRNETIH